ncbi:MAG: DUF2029 domain-containing protein [Ignavibacteria bacterium]|nr:DUF2029 domain-containing protein [Ignavibacteria bacterium]MBI3766337.1 DUF2029 domain-containing protein [Ignavibacteriales bacterium]
MRESSAPSVNTSRSRLIVLIALVVLTRLPSLPLGYGSDGDGWRVAWSASKLWNEGVYQPSRFPGFPVYEIINAPLIGLGGSFASNIATLIVFVLALLLFRRILLKIEVQAANLLLWTFAFLPILWKNSAVTMDYLWGLTFILLSYLLVLQGRFLLASITLGLAVGTRLTHAILLFPLFFLLEGERVKKKFVLMAFVTAGVSILCYLPVFLRAAFRDEIARYIADVRDYTILQRVEFFLYRSTYSIGLIATIGIFLCVLIYRRQIIDKLRQRDRYVLTCVAVIVVMLFIFFVLADEREYLIPMMPFLLIALGLTLPRKAVRIICGCLMVYNVVNVDLIEHNFGKQRFSPSISTGFILREYSVRNKIFDWRESLSHYALPDSSILMIANGPIFWVENPHVTTSKTIVNMFRDEDVAVSRTKQHLYYVYALSYPEVKKYTAQGYRLYYVAGMKAYLESFLHYDLDTAGIQPINVPIP